MNRNTVDKYEKGAKKRRQKTKEIKKEEKRTEKKKKKKLKSVQMVDGCQLESGYMQVAVEWILKLRVIEVRR